MYIYLLPLQEADSLSQVRRILASRFALPSARFRTRPDGKPELLLPDGAPPLFFNLSHSGELLAAAFDDAEVGVDIESLSRRISPRLWKRMLSPEEIRSFTEEFGALPQDPAGLTPALARCLLRRWTLKEALTKTTGTGLRTDFRTLTVLPAEDGRFCCPQIPEVELITFSPGPGYVGAAGRMRTQAQNRL